MTKKQIALDMILLTLLGGFFFCLFSGSYPFLVPDEARYVEISRAMVASGNYITPHLNGSLFLDKPILLYWCESIFIHLFGLHEWSMRLLPACCGVLGCLVTYWSGTKLYHRRVGLLSALILMTMGFYFFTAHYINMDLMVAVLISCALWLFIVAAYEPQEKARLRQCLLAYVFIGFAFLAKGLIGFVFPVAIVGLWIIIMNRWQLLKSMHVIAGLIIIAVIVMPWLLMIQRETPLFAYYFFYVQQFSRYLTKNFHQHQPFFFYIPIVLAGCLPWSLFLCQSVWFFINDVINNMKNAGKALFILIWIFCIFIFFSIPHSKLAGYILPIFPPIAMMIARYLDVNWETLAKTKQLKLCSIIWSLLALIMSFAFMEIVHRHWWVSVDSISYLHILSGLLLVSALLSIASAFFVRTVNIFFVMLLCSTSIAELTATASIWTYPLNSIKPLALEIRQRIKPQDRVVSFDRYYYDLPLYLDRPVLVVSDWHLSLSIKDNWRKELGEGILYQHVQQPLLIDQQQFNMLWHGSHRVFVVVSVGDEAIALRQLVQSPVYPLGRSGREVLLSNEE